MADLQTEAIPVIEEGVVVTKRPVVTGTVRVRTETTIEEEPVNVTLLKDSVEVSRIPIDREVVETPSVRTEGEFTIIPVVEERLVVRKQLVLVEEIHIRRQASAEQVSVPVALRKQRAVVERTAAPNTTDLQPDEDIK